MSGVPRTSAHFVRNSTNNSVKNPANPSEHGYHHGPIANPTHGWVPPSHQASRGGRLICLRYALHQATEKAALAKRPGCKRTLSIREPIGHRVLLCDSVCHYTLDLVNHFDLSRCTVTIDSHCASSKKSGASAKKPRAICRRSNADAKKSGPSAKTPTRSCGTLLSPPNPSPSPPSGPPLSTTTLRAAEVTDTGIRSRSE
ncbi:uncharacterized protein B0T15DRAFT_227520 [Chaetomium strumarium]|uniref:Uncharacterized protein n=1 Tax=Chaetomium strumarium TaxID=1170767 RepID=A0AAJ0GQ09_9PEZI|nr:hypothetical protein B0T15DRAFT_227520 [Chaetomium strumarium]